MPIVMYASDFRILTGTQKFEECRSAKPPELPYLVYTYRIILCYLQNRYFSNFDNAIINYGKGRLFKL